MLILTNVVKAVPQSFGTDICKVEGVELVFEFRQEVEGEHTSPTTQIKSTLGLECGHLIEQLAVD